MDYIFTATKIPPDKNGRFVKLNKNREKVFENVEDKK